MKKYATIRNANGELVELSGRADTIALYFQNVQWKVHFANLTLQTRNIINTNLNVSEQHFTMEEMKAVLHKLKQGKAQGHDDIPPDFWKFIGEYACSCKELLALCNHCWDENAIPDCWKIAKVILLFKKR